MKHTLMLNAFILRICVGRVLVIFEKFSKHKHTSISVFGILRIFGIIFHLCRDKSIFLEATKDIFMSSKYFLNYCIRLSLGLFSKFVEA